MAYTNQQQGMQSHLEAYNEIMKKYRDHQQGAQGVAIPREFTQLVLTLIVLQTSMTRNPPNFILNQVFTCVNHVIRLMVMLVVIMI